MLGHGGSNYTGLHEGVQSYLYEITKALLVLALVLNLQEKGTACESCSQNIH